MEEELAEERRHKRATKGIIVKGAANDLVILLNFLKITLIENKSAVFQLLSTHT